MAKNKKQTQNQDTNDSNINMNYNVAVSGLDMDSSLNQVAKGKLTYALNASVENFDNTAINYQNEPGNEFCVTFPTDFVLIGSHYIQEKAKHIFFLTNPLTGDCHIGYMDNNDCVYKIYVNDPCLGWNIKYPIHKIVHKISNCSTEIFWPDNVARRYLDLDNIPYTLKTGSTLCDPQYTQTVDCNQLKVQPNFTIPQLSVIDAITGGNNTAGTVQFAIQYSDALSNPYTSYYSVTNPTPIADTQIVTQNYNYPVGKSIVVQIDDLDTTGQFQYFNLAVIKTVNDITSVELIGTYFIDQVSKTITYTGQNQEQIKLTVNDIFEKFPYYELADDITSVQDVLVWKGLTSIDRINYQSIATNIDLQWESWRIPASENYADEINATNLRGYLRDEIYAFEIVFLLKNGKQTDGFHIPGRVKNSNEAWPDVPNTNQDFIGDTESEPYWKIYNTASVIDNSPGYSADASYKGPYEYGEFAYWESADVYPCNEEIWGELANQPIRHHKFPDVLVSPIFESSLFTTADNMVMQNDAIFPIGVKIDIDQVKNLIAFSNLTDSQKDDIVGFKIIRGNRGTNKSIIAKGILRDVGEYTKEEQRFYFPNYPYNDVNEDPFLIKNNNAYQVIAEPWLVMCSPLGPGKYTYVDINTGREVTTRISAGEVREFLSVSRPVRKGGQLLIVPANFDVWFATAETSAPWIKIKWNTPLTNGTLSSIAKERTLYPDVAFWSADDIENALTTVDGGVEVICPTSNPAPCGIDPVLTPPGAPEALNTVSGISFSLFSFTFKPTKSRRSTLNPREPEQLKAFENQDNRYRQIFNSPETSFAQPFLGNVLKLESVIYGTGKAHFTAVKDNAKYKLLSEEAQIEALDSSRRIGKLTRPFNATAMFTAYQAYLTIYVNGITRKNYAYSFNSIASYNYTEAIPNNLGVKQREIDYTQYLIPGVQSVGDANGVVMNNFQRESSVFIKTVETKNDVSYTAFSFPHQSPNMIVDGVPKVTDKSRFTISSSGACSTPAKDQSINVVSYYASMKNTFINQWGQIYSYDTVDTGFQKNVTAVGTATIFGGDTFINRFAFKTKLPFFFDNRVNAPDDSDIFYDEIGNVSYPKYWHSARSILKGYILNGELLANIISYKAHNFDCPNDTQFIENSDSDFVTTTTTSTTLEFGNYETATIINSASRTFYDGYFYLFAYGIPNFYCESSYNIDLRQAFNNKEGDFWPHVTNSIPDEWVQETNVSIANDNTYTYNVTFSKQNKENFFSHLPTDWDNKDCYTYFPFRGTYSDTQNQNADVRVNNWLIYRATSQFDFPQNFGKLTSLDGIQDKAILARFENKSLLYNKLLTLNTSNPQAAYLGNPDMFSTPPIDFAETDLGYVGSQNKFLLKIPQGQISIDAKRGQIFLITGEQAQDLTAYGSGVNRFMTDHLAFEILRYFPNVPTDNHFNGIGLHGVYDSKFDRVIFSKIDYIPISNDIKYDSDNDTYYVEQTINEIVFRTQVYLTDPDYFCNKSWTISFNFNTKSWISFHSYIPNWYIGDNNFFYSGINGCCTDLDADADGFTAIVGTLDKIPSTTTSTSTAAITTSSTTTIPVKPVYCDMAANAILTSCDLEGTGLITVPATTTTTICARPSGLAIFSFVSGYKIGADPDVDSTASLASACAAISITVTKSPDIVVNGFTVGASSLELGSIVYVDGAASDCTLVPDGWYYTPSGQDSGFAYRIVAGVITEISTCDCGVIPDITEEVYNVPECCGILLTDGNDVYYYNSNMNLLNVPGFTSTYGIAMTSHYLWSVTTAFLQWDITLAPFTATYNTSITFPVGFTTSSGIVAIDDSTLVAIDDSVAPPNVVELIIDNPVSPTFVTPVIKFALQANRIAAGNMLYTNDGKLIVINQDTISSDYYLTQYDYATGTIEMDLVLTVIPTSISQCDCTIFITVGTTVYAIEKTSPNSIVEVTTISTAPISATQIATCVGGTLVDITTTTTTTIAPTTTTTTTL
jgi:hypothetical protein